MPSIKGVGEMGYTASDPLVYLDRSADMPLYQQLYDSIRRSITSGVLPEGSLLPSFRRASALWGLSHITVEKAYSQLVAEGYIENVPRLGHVVNSVDTAFFDQTPRQEDVDPVRLLRIRSREAFFSESLDARTATYDFQYTAVLPGSFPAKIWSRLTTEVLLDGDPLLLTSYSLEDEPDILAVELASYLRSARGVRCVPEQVIVRAGSKDSFLSVFNLLRNDPRPVACELPAYDTFAGVAGMVGERVCSVPVLDGWDGYVGALWASGAKLLFCTPSHQFPTGVVMPLATRIELLEWARINDAYILEDDACCEFRYHTQPIPSMQSLDRYDRVIYMGNFSKALSPDLRISYLVLPPLLLEKYWSPLWFCASQVPRLTREVLGRFLGRGYWERHLHKLVSAYAKRHDALLSCLQESFADSLELSGVDSGMHLYVRLLCPPPVEGLCASALARGVKVYSPRAYWYNCAMPSNEAIIGFTSIDAALIEPGIAELAQAWLGR